MRLPTHPYRRARAVLLMMVQLAGVVSLANSSSTPTLEIELETHKAFSNLEWIPLRIHIIPQAASLDGMRIVTGTKLVEGSGPVLRITAYDAKEQKEISVTAVKSGEGRNRSEHYLDLSIGLPVPDAQRDQAVQQYLAFVNEKAKTEKPPAADVYKSQNGQTAISNTLKHMFFQNRAGKFIVKAALTVNLPDQWKLTVEAQPRTIEIQHVGEFFDQPAFRK